MSALKFFEKQCSAFSRIFTVGHCLVCCFCSQMLIECYQWGQELTPTKRAGHWDFEFVYHVGHKAFDLLLCLNMDMNVYAFFQISVGRQVPTSGYSSDTQMPAFPLTLTEGKVFSLSERKAIKETVVHPLWHSCPKIAAIRELLGFPKLRARTSQTSLSSSPTIYSLATDTLTTSLRSFLFCLTKLLWEINRTMCAKCQVWHRHSRDG